MNCFYFVDKNEKQIELIKQLCRRERIICREYIENKQSFSVEFCNNNVPMYNTYLLSSWLPIPSLDCCTKTTKLEIQTDLYHFEYIKYLYEKEWKRLKNKQRKQRKKENKLKQSRKQLEKLLKRK